MIDAARTIAHSPERVYAFLAHLDNHWHLSDRWLRLVRTSADGRGGVIVLTTPLGLRRTALTTITTANAPGTFGGLVAVGRRTSASTHWKIEAHERGSRVRLEAIVDQAGPLDRLLLALGGRRWLRWRFGQMLARLAAALDRV
jgi:hypothetical protein